MHVTVDSGYWNLPNLYRRGGLHPSAIHLADPRASDTKLISLAELWSGSDPNARDDDGIFLTEQAISGLGFSAEYREILKIATEIPAFDWLNGKCSKSNLETLAVSAKVLCWHAAMKHAYFITDNENAFIISPKRILLESILNTRICTPSEIFAVLGRKALPNK